MMSVCFSRITLIRTRTKGASTSICLRSKRSSRSSFERSTRIISTTNIGKLHPGFLIYKHIYNEYIQLDNYNYNYYIYYDHSDTLKRNYLLGHYFLEVEIEDLAGFDETLADKLHQQPTENLAIFEDAAREVADEITAPRPEHEEEVQDIQVLLSSGANATNIRDLKVSQSILY